MRDVTVEHPIYGELTGSLMIASRQDVERFSKSLTVTNASLLSALTGGTHLHTIEADSDQKLNDALNALDEKGFLLHD